MQFDPDDADSEPSPPLGKATDWVNVELDLGDGFKPYTRDTNVMPQWAGSSWYELRYTDPYNKEELCAKENEAYWMGPRPAEHGPNDPGGVDLYVGGVEHAVLHLLYCPVLAQGALRPGPRQLARAVPPAGQPGLHPGVRLHRLARCLCARRRGRRTRRQVLLDRARRRDRGQPGVRQDRQEPEELGVAGRDLRRLRRRHAAGLRDVDGPAGGVAAVGDQGRRRRVPVPAAGVAAGRRRGDRRRAGRRARAAGRRDAAAAAPHDRRGRPTTTRTCATTPRRPSSSSTPTT